MALLARSGALLPGDYSGHLPQGHGAGGVLATGSLPTRLRSRIVVYKHIAIQKETGLNSMFRRLRHIVRKELIQMFRDRATFRILVLTPVLQLLIYGYVVTTDIREIPVV